MTLPPDPVSTAPGTSASSIATAQAYIEQRILPRVRWFDRRAVGSRRIFMASQYLAAILSVSIIVLLEVESVPRAVLAALAATIALIVVVERIGQFGQLWQLYRLSAEALIAEVNLFRHSAGPYSTASESAERVLVERVERICQHEAFRWSSLMEAGGTEARKGMFPSA